MYKLDKIKKVRKNLNSKMNVIVKNELTIKVMDAHYCIGEMDNVGLKCYIVNEDNIESTWELTEFEREYYNNALRNVC